MASDNPFLAAIEEQPAGNPFLEAIGSGSALPKSAKKKERSLWENIQGGTAQALQGATLGWSDEIGSGLAAGLAAAQGYGEGEGFLNRFKDVYADMSGRTREREKEWAEDNAKTALGLNLAGGLATSLATGGLGAAAKGTQAATTGAKLLPRAASAAKNLAIEGGIAGAGAADEGDTLQGALLGAGTNVALGGLLSGAKGAFNQATKRRVAEDLVDEAGNFSPINVAAPDSKLGDFYKNIGRSLGGGKIKEQTKEAIGRHNQTVSALEKTVQKKLFKDALPEGMREADIDLNNPNETLKAFKQSWNQDAFKEVKDANFKVDEQDIIDKVRQRLDDPAFEKQQGPIVRMLKESIGDKMERDMVPSGKYYYDAAGARKPTAKVEASTGKVRGKDMMEARNELRRIVNAANESDASPLQRRAAAVAADILDEEIENGLPPAAQARFLKEKQRYGAFQVLDEAMAQAKKKRSADTMEFGDLPDIDTVYKAALANNQAGASTLSGTYQKIAQEAQKEGAGLARTKERLIRALPSEAGIANQAFQASTAGLPMAQVQKVLTGNEPGYAARIAYGLPAILGATSEQGQKLVAGQTPTQEMLREFLKNYRGSGAKQVVDPTAEALRRFAAMSAAD